MPVHVYACIMLVCMILITCFLIWRGILEDVVHPPSFHQCYCNTCVIPYTCKDPTILYMFVKGIVEHETN